MSEFAGGTASREILVVPTFDDVVALSELVNIDSPRARTRISRSRWLFAGGLGATGLFFLVRGAPGMSLVFFAAAAGFAIFWPTYMRHAWRRSIIRTVREAFGPSDPPPASLRLEADGVREIGDGIDRYWAYDKVVRIVESCGRVFVFTDPMMAVVIPLGHAAEGEPRAFVDDLARRSGREIERPS